MFLRRKQEQQAIVSQTPAFKKARMVPELATCFYKDTGNRKYQQDEIYVSESKLLAANKRTRVLAVVCDGMGGMADGALASRTGVQILREDFQKIEKEANVNIPVFLEKEVRKIDRIISQFEGKGQGSGTTVVAAIAEDRDLYWVSVGDSRIYILRDGQMRQVTRDHNYALRLQDMVANGAITAEDARQNPQKEALISYLGMGGLELIDINVQPFQMQFGDIILLCSDGVTKTICDDRIQEIVMSPVSSMEKKAETLVMAAVRENTHSQDNTSVAILQYKNKNIKEK